MKRLLPIVAAFAVVLGLAVWAHPAWAQNITIDLGNEGENGTMTGRVVQLMAMLTILSLAPWILIMMTSFTRIVVVLSFLRTAIGIQQTPPNTVMISLALWATDFLHGIRPGWIALAAAVVSMLPRIGAVPVTLFQERIKFGSFFYIGAVLGLGAVMLDSGFSKAFGDVLLSVIRLEQGADAANFITLSVMSTFASMIVTNPAQPALLSPLAGAIADASGWPIQTALMTFAVGFSTLLLPYQAPPMVVGSTFETN